jgi:hypothetical protein
MDCFNQFVNTACGRDCRGKEGKHVSHVIYSA